MTWALHTDTDLDGCNLHLASLEHAGLLGIVEEDGRAIAYFPQVVDGLPLDGMWVAVPQRDWNAEWRASIAPVVAGRITIVPPWLSPPQADITIVIEPGQAFGTGHHATTHGCLTALQREPLSGRSVLDVGTGTGVLAIAAMMLGAREAVAIDDDPVAVETARANCWANHTTIDVREGSLEVLDDLADVVIANLDTATLTAAAHGLVALVAPGGVLIASGVSIERSDEVHSALSDAGLALEVAAGQEWAVLTGRRA